MEAGLWGLLQVGTLAPGGAPAGQPRRAAGKLVTSCPGDSWGVAASLGWSG